MMADNLQELWDNLIQTALTMGLFTAALWLIHIVDALAFKGALKRRFGIKPRSRFSLLAILFSPFLHLDRRHLAANTIPFFILGSLVLIQGQITFWISTLIIILVAGLGVWLFGKPGTQHMGASSLILGYFGFLLAGVFFDFDIITLLIAVIVALLYLGLITQIIPLKKGVSTTGHLFGFLAGVLSAFLAGYFPT